MDRTVISPRQIERPQPRRVNGKDSLMFGSSLADVFRTPDYDCRALGVDQKPEFAITRLRSGPRETEKAPVYPADDAILICVSLTPAAVGQWHALYNGRKVGVTRAIPFATTFIDLNCRMEMWVRGPFDYLHYYIARGVLEKIARDNDVAQNFRLQEVFFVEDLLVAQLTKSILASVTHGEPLDRLALDQIAMVLGAHALQTHCGAPKFSVAAKRGLEPWQKLRAEEMLRGHLEGDITVRELAIACALSESHFARCFRKTFGTTVHQRLIQLRIDRAKELLSGTKKSAAEIALLAGFFDQSAFTRTFSRIERISPSRWRRFNNET